MSIRIEPSESQVASAEPDLQAAGAQATNIAAPGGAVTPHQRVKRHKHKSAKMRGVWISFAGRIVAQFVGSAASILLGIMLIQRYQAPAANAGNAPAAENPISYEGREARPRVVNGRAVPSLVVLPVDDFSTLGGQAQLARALTEIVTASLAGRDAISVISRTTSSRLNAGRMTVPAISRELGVDLILETSVARSASRVRVVAQLIDGRSDEHLWSRRYDREAGDELATQAELADAIARDVEAYLSASASRNQTLASRISGATSNPPLSFSAGTPAQADAAGREQTP